MNLVLYDEGRVSSYDLERQSEWSIGRLNSTITLHSKITGRHQGVLRKENGLWIFVDGGSTNGTFYNSKKMIPGMSVVLNYGDILRVDNKTLNSPAGVYMLIVREEEDNNWKIYDLNENEKTYIGRNSQLCQIRQPNLAMSRRHACVQRMNGHFYVRDCESQAGTWVNSVEADQPVCLNEGDIIHMADCHFYFTSHYLVYNQLMHNPATIEQSMSKMAYSSSTSSGKSVKSQPEENFNAHRPYLIKANIHSKVVKNMSGSGMIQLLKDVKINVKKGSLVAILGSAGAGKSTIMNCMNGIEQDGVEGTILFGNEDLYRNYERLKFQIGCVPQENTFHPDLKVRQELIQAAEKRMTRDVNKSEIPARVDAIIDKLGLSDKKNQQIRKLSGGEQRRVHVGIELVAQRLLYCLDEPDAGLDPANKKKLFEILKDLVKTQDKTIMVIIHDVAEIDMFDQIIFMTKLNGIGRLAFSGSPAEAREYFGVQNIKNIYEKLVANPERYVK